MKRNYDDWNKKELIEEIEKLKKRKKYGLVWNNISEDVVDRCKKEFPFLDELESKKIINDNLLDPNLIIEGDNYHALACLNYTHKNKIDLIYIDPPYNTGARDWMYNNDYVVDEDPYRHSKWISMMSNRLHLAKNLLSEDGVLICTIDKYEQPRLNLLLEEIFFDYEIVCITIVHNPAGTQGKNFSYTNEYAFFVFPKNGQYIAKTTRETDLESSFRDWGPISLRSHAKNCFYPIIIKNMQIINFGDVCKDSFHPKSSNINNKDGTISVYPISKEGEEKKWVFSRQNVEKIKDQLFIKKDKNQFSVFRKKNEASYKTVWEDKKFYANVYGSNLLNQIIDSKFPFPKSLYATMECIKAVIHNKDNAIILDFFAGSGTTGHAVMQLNKEDNGKRSFILCTNNENKIAEKVTYERIKKVINGYKNLKNKNKTVEGLGGNLRYFKSSFLPSLITDQSKSIFAKKMKSIICIKENTYNKFFENKDYCVFSNNYQYTTIIFNNDKLDEVKDKISNFKLHNKIYIFSLSNETHDEVFDEIEDKELIPIPEEMIKIYKNIL